MSDELRTAVINAISGDGATLVEIHERTGEDSRRAGDAAFWQARRSRPARARKGAAWCGA
jgi:hypothetical protein